MKIKKKSIFVFLLLSFWVHSFYGMGSDTIRFSLRYPNYEIYYLLADSGKQFTVDWGDGSDIEILTQTTKDWIYFFHNYEWNTAKASVTIAGVLDDCFVYEFISISSIDTIDISNHKALTYLSCNPNAPEKLLSLNINGCTSLEYLNCNIGKLTKLDVSSCLPLKHISCSRNLLDTLDLSANINLREIFVLNNWLTHIDITNIPILYDAGCYENRLLLSEMYPFSLIIDNPNRLYLGVQKLPQKTITLGESIDFSLEKEFGGIPTNFQISCAPENYSLSEGILTFHNPGNYNVVMTNPALVCNPDKPAHVTAPIKIINFIPVTEIIDVPTETVAGVPLLLIGTVLPNNATYKTIVWSVKDAGTTDATLNGNKLNTTAPGIVVVTATIKDGKTLGTDYEQNFEIEVTPLGINAIKQELINVYPNPTTGELVIESGGLSIENVEIFDMNGRNVLSNYHINTSSNHLINISHLPAGVYFVKIQTETGEVVRRVLKE